MTRDARAMLMCLTAVLMLTACSSLRPKAPQVAIAGVGVEEIAADTQKLALRLKLTNPNDRELPIDALDFAVEVGGVRVATGASTKPVTLPRLGEATMEVSALTDLARLMKQVGELQKSGLDAVPYRIAGTVRSPLAGDGAQPFTSRGEMRLPRLLKYFTPRGTAPEAPPPATSE